MDIRSIIDSDTTDSVPAKQFSSQRFDPKAGYQQPQPNLSYEAKSPAHKRQRSKRPPQPPPLQPPVQPMYSVIRSPSASSHNSVQSPYQQTPSSVLSSGHYPYLPALSTQSPAHGFQLSPNSQRESHAASKPTNYLPYGQQTSASQTPGVTTPISYHHAYARQGSSHSLSNPTSAQNQSPNTFKDSPQSSQSQIRNSSQSASSQQHLSQPGTPLGPPSMIIGRPSLPLSRESPGLYEHQRNNSAGTYGHQQLTASSPGIDPLAYSTTSPLASAPAQSFSQAQIYHNKQERGRSLSVSPKTLSGELDFRRPVEDPITSSMDYNMQPGVDTMARSMNHSVHVNDHLNSTKRAIGEDVYSSQEQTALQSPTRSRSFGMKGLLNPPSVNELALVSEECPRTKKRKFSVSDHEVKEPPTTLESQESKSFLPSPAELHSEKPLSHHPSTHQQSSQSRATQELSQSQKSPDSPLNQQKSPTMSSTPPPSHAKINSASSPLADATEQENLNKQGLDEVTSFDDPTIEPPKRGKRSEQPPIYAQSCRKGKLPHTSNKKVTGNRATLTRQDSATGRPSLSPTPQQSISSTAKQLKQGMNGYASPSVENNISKIPQKPADSGMLGDWEENILNTRPSEEAIKAVSDFLYKEVVGRLDVGVGPAGGGSSKGAMMEIEAKIGQLIDKNTNERLRLPVATECVLQRDDPSLRVNFKSSMTEAQHRSLNGFLNQAFGRSLAKPRVPMSYVHTHECDTFHELSQAGVIGLPASIRSLLNPRHNQVKVRITTDQKTGNELAKIVKVRIADLDIYSPRTAFDWRVSVNVEMNFDGDMKDLLEPQARNGRRAERNKDRMSYKHLAYQIDLTQVTTAEATSKTDKEHELEIEVSAAELRKHGILLKEGRHNEYEKLVMGFVNNVRVLVRQF